MNMTPDDWTIKHLKEHLQAAVDLEFWTIPFYMSAMYSIKNRSSSAYQMLRTVVNQEMLHLQCAANIANAYGLSPAIYVPPYKGKAIPHLKFPRKEKEDYRPYTAEIGPFNLEHINAMCLIEYPEYEDTELQQGKSLLEKNIGKYPSIGAFYRALRIGAEHFKDSIKGGRRQVNYFSAFYRNMPNMAITESGAAGFDQVALLIDIIVEQGEGECKKNPTIPSAFQNTADDTEPGYDHFAKFSRFKKDMGVDKKPLADVYTAKACSEYTDEDKQLVTILTEQFNQLRYLLQKLFSGENPENFFSIMASVGGAISNCWHHGVTPEFSEKADLQAGNESQSIIYHLTEQLN